MQHRDHLLFIQAIHEKRKILCRYWSHEDNAELVRVCAPYDFAPSRRYKDPSPRYHFWNYQSDSGPHPMGLIADQIREMTLLEERFEPAEIVNWDVAKRPWTVTRDWGDYGS